MSPQERAKFAAAIEAGEKNKRDMSEPVREIWVGDNLLQEFDWHGNKLVVLNGKIKQMDYLSVWFELLEKQGKVSNVQIEVGPNFDFDEFERSQRGE